MKHHDPQNRKNTDRSLAHSEPKDGPSVAERVRLRAYQLFERRNGRPGDPVSDWVQAEREVLGSAQNPSGRR